MKVFFNVATAGFYVDEVHGPRTLVIADPQWKRPVIEIDDPNWVQPVLTVPDPSWVNDGSDPDAMAPLVEVPDRGAVPPKISFPDMSASAPEIEIDNPDCRIPVGAVEITQERHQELLAAQSNGMRIQAGQDGLPEAVEPPAPTPTEIALRQIKALEALVTPRRQREAILGLDDGWLADIDAQIAALRATL